MRKEGAAVPDRIKNSLPGAVGGVIGVGLTLGLKGIYRGMDLFWFCAIEFITIFAINFLFIHKDKSKKQ